jgi:uncharacterized protein (TIGR03118 family)
MLNAKKQRKHPLWIVVTLAIAAAFVVLPAQAQKYTRTDLVTDATDPDLINAWGMSRSAGSPWWVSDNGTGKTTLYDGAGVKQGLVVTIPTPNGQGTSAPTGQVFNYTTGFEVAPTFPAVFIFVTEDGTISAWNPKVDATHAIIKVNRSDSAVYKGVALEQTATGPQLFATNFQTGAVEVFDSKFNPVVLQNPTKFRIPRLNQNWSPFGIQSIGGNLVVTFAHRPPGQHDEDHGPGLGWIGVFDTQGNLLSVMEHGDWDNAPWGIAMSPGDFGAFPHSLLIGNFGDGWIHVYNAFTGKHEGYLQDQNGAPIAIDGLWGLAFGNNAKAGSAIELYFTAGPNDESGGLFGKLVPIATDQRGSND